jgi:hypothetical protein
MLARKTHVLTLLAAAILHCHAPCRAGGLTDDRQITIRSAKDVEDKRRALHQFIWGPTGFPTTKLPSSAARNIKSPVDKLGNLHRVDEIRIKMDANEESLAHHFIPVRKNHQLVIVHHGHADTLNDNPAVDDRAYGMQRTINALLLDGYAVLGMYMPRFRPGDMRHDHDAMFKIKTKAGNPMQFFLEPIAVCLNYLRSKSDADEFPRYQDFHMAGLSGGGWTTTVYAAIDPTIKFSFPVAGTIPLYLRSGGSIGDTEQFLPDFYRIAGYPDLYVLGSHGADRKQIQILVRRDDCCFGERQHNAMTTKMSYVQAMRKYELEVRQTLAKLDSGSFLLELDDAAPSHMISQNAIANVMLAELNHARRPVGAATGSDACVRGRNGHLWRHGLDGWQDLGFTMVGTPAVLDGAVNKLDVFFRDPDNRLKHAALSKAGWTLHDLKGVVITDPVAASWGPGRFDIVALGGDYRLYHWWHDGGTIHQERVSDTAKALGPPALVARGPGRLDLFVRGWDRNIHHLHSSGKAPWTLDKLERTILDFPTAVATGRDELAIYVRDESMQLWEGRQAKGNAWKWTSLTAVTKSPANSLWGMPSAAVRDNRVMVHVRTTAGNLATFDSVGGDWYLTKHGQAVTGAVTATPGGAFARGKNGGLVRLENSRWAALGGGFD